jgi:hypothetical protein
MTRAALPLASTAADSVFVPIVAYTITNYVYINGFDNWLNGVRAALMVPAVGATDAKTYRYFQRRSVDVLLLNDSASQGFAFRSLYMKTEACLRRLTPRASARS